MKLTVLACALFCSSQLLGVDISEQLQQIPYKERVYLEHFFRKSISHNQLGYVLFFEDKPASLCIVKSPTSCHLKTKLAAKGWRVWEKYEHLFPHPNFVFCKEKKTNSNSFCLFVLNKTTARRVVQAHEERFKDVLDPMYTKLFGQPFSADLFLQKVEQCKFLDPLILGDDTLLGLLLGYGAESSELWKRRKNLQPDERWESIPSLNKHLILHGTRGRTYYNNFGVCPVVWGGNPDSEEVQELSKVYETQCIALRRMFRRKACSKSVLDALCNGG